MSDNIAGVTREITNLLEQNNNAIQDRLVETYAILNEYEPKLASIDKSIQQQKDLIEDQKSLIEEFNQESLSKTKEFEKISESFKRVVEGFDNKIKNFEKRRMRFFWVSAMVSGIVVTVSTFFVVIGAEFYFKLDLSKTIIASLEKKHVEIRKTYEDDIDVMEHFRKKGFFVSKEAFLAPPNEIKEIGWSEKRQGMWFKK